MRKDVSKKMDVKLKTPSFQMFLYSMLNNKTCYKKNLNNVSVSSRGITGPYFCSLTDNITKEKKERNIKIPLWRYFITLLIVLEDFEFSRLSRRLLKFSLMNPKSTKTQLVLIQATCTRNLKTLVWRKKWQKYW